MTIPKEDAITEKEFMDFQNGKFKNRRRLAFITAIAYFGLAFYMVFEVDPTNFDNYEGFFMQYSLFCSAVILSYFGGSSFEEVKVDRSQLVDEFLKLREFSKNKKQETQNEVG